MNGKNLKGELMAPALNAWSSATQCPSFPSPDRSWIRLLRSIRALMFAFSVIMLHKKNVGHGRPEGEMKWARVKGREGMRWERRKMSRFLSEGYRLPNTRQGDCIYREIPTPSLLSLQECGSSVNNSLPSHFSSTLHKREKMSFFL